MLLFPISFIAQAPFQNPWKYRIMKERERNPRERRKREREIKGRNEERESEDRSVCITEIQNTA